MIKYVEFQFEGKTLRGMLHTPEGIEMPPITILLHGFTSDKNNLNFSSATLAKKLATQGIASVRFDFLGSGDSDGEFEDMTISAEIAEACAMVDFVKTLDYVDSNRIGIYGNSLGGAISSAVASTKNSDIKALCMCCPATNSIYEARDLKVKGQDMSSILTDGYFDVDGLKLGKGYYDDALNIDFYEMAEGYYGPVKLVHGDKDFIAPLENSKKYLELYGDKASLELVEGGDHSFTSLRTNNERLDIVTDFFVDILG